MKMPSQYHKCLTYICRPLYIMFLTCHYPHIPRVYFQLQYIPYPHLCRASLEQMTQGPTSLVPTKYFLGKNSNHQKQIKYDTETNINHFITYYVHYVHLS